MYNTCIRHLHRTLSFKMNKKRFEEFANYLEAFTQRLTKSFPHCNNFVFNEKREMLERFPELSTRQHQRQPQQSQRDQQAVVKLALTSTCDPERRKDYFGVEDTVKRETPEDMIQSINTLSRAIASSHKDILLYSALQGDMLTQLKEMSADSFTTLLRNNIDISRSYANFLMRFYKLVQNYPRLLQCKLPISFFQKNFNKIEIICAEDEMSWKEM